VAILNRKLGEKPAQIKDKNLDLILNPEDQISRKAAKFTQRHKENLS
jgi:hypothetical protein